MSKLMKIPLTLKNFLALMGSNFAVQLLRFLTLTILARQLSIEGFGAYNYVVLVLSYAMIVVEFGLKNLAIRELAQGRVGMKFVGQVVKVRLGLAFIILPIVWSIISRGAPILTQDALFYFVASLILNAVLLDFVVIAKEQLAYQGFVNLFQAALFLLGCLVLVHSDQDLLLLSQIYFISQLVWSGLFLIRGLGEKLPVDLNSPFEKSAYDALKGGLPLAVVALLGGFQFSVDLFLLGQMGYSQSLGPYSAATKILALALGVINAFLAALQPRFARGTYDLKSEFMRELLGSTVKLLLLVLLPLIAMCWYSGEVLLTFFFGAKFQEGQEFLRPLCLAFLFFILALPATHTYNVSHLVKRNLIFTTLNIGFTTILCWTFLSAYGPNLLPWAMAISQLVFLISAWWSLGFARLFKFKDVIPFVMPTVVFIILLQTPLAHSIGGIFLGGLAYLSLLVFHKKEIGAWLKKAFN